MSKLFCDCKTDEEKSNFFLSGRGVETGVIAPTISNEVAMAFHRCFEFEKQLAAKRALLRQARDALEYIQPWCNGQYNGHEKCQNLIFKCLAAIDKEPKP